MKIAYVFAAVCCFFGAGLIAFDSFVGGDGHAVTKKPQAKYVHCEVWTDEKTGHRFLVAIRKWDIGGVGVCLIPDFKKEDDEEHIEVPHPRDLESTAGWKESR